MKAKIRGLTHNPSLHPSRRRDQSELAGAIVARFLSDMAMSTWQERFPEAYADLTRYHVDIEKGVLDLLKEYGS